MRHLFLLLALTPGAALAQLPASGLKCDGLPIGYACFLQEAPVPFAGSLAADTAGNGSIAVTSWDGDGVWVRSRIVASSWTTAFAVSLQISDGRVQAAGPARKHNVDWSVSFEIFVPRQADLALDTLNGAIDLTGIRGTLRFSTMNGSVSLRDLAGDVAGSTMNGAVAVALTGDRWDGKGLTVQTMNGAVTVTVPAVYSAHFELSNMVGTFTTNLPVPAAPNGRIGHKISFDDGAGGATVKVSTMNGAISLQTPVVP